MMGEFVQAVPMVHTKDSTVLISVPDALMACNAALQQTDPAFRLVAMDAVQIAWKLVLQTAKHAS